MYHYSPKTQKPEICKASKRENCPYCDCLHSQMVDVVQAYADKENELLSKLPPQQMEYFTSDLMSYTGKVPMILSAGKSSDPIEQGYEITEATYKYLGIDDSTRVWLSNFDKVFVIPENGRFVQSFLQDPDGINVCYKTLRDSFNERRLGVPGGQPYDKWDAVEYLDYAKYKQGVSVMDIEINKKDPYGNNSYTLTSMWNDFLAVSDKQTKVFYSKKNKNRFYIIGGNMEYNK